MGDLVYGAIDSLLKSRDVEFEIILATSEKHRIRSFQERYPSILVIDIDGQPARKRNIATRFAMGDYFAFFDDDVHVTPYTLYFLLRECEKDGVGMVYGKLLNMEFRNRFDEAGSFLTWSGFLYARCESGIEDKGQFEDTVPVLAGKSASCIVRRKAFWGVGGFDESFGILGEETDLSWRIWLRGMKVMFCPKSVTYHAFNTRFKPADFYTPARVYFNGCRNYIAMLLANLGIANLIVPLITQTLVWLGAGVGFAITGKFEASKNIFKAFGYLAVNFNRIIRKRRDVQSSRVLKDFQLLPIITHNPPLSYYIKRFLHYIATGRHG